jgi:hypothetical protein
MLATVFIMGVNFKDIDIGHITPQCSDCGVCLCWGIDEIEYLKWKGFWDNWTCRDCNPNYKGAYQEYQNKNKPFQEVEAILNGG